MDPKLIPVLIQPLIDKVADYVKGSRLTCDAHTSTMPSIRYIGNIIATAVSKPSSGYWDISDPTNGYFALTVNTALRLPWDRLSRRVFFESDLLYWLNKINAKVIDIPMKARYGTEESSIRPIYHIFVFCFGYFNNMNLRLFQKILQLAQMIYRNSQKIVLF